MGDRDREDLLTFQSMISPGGASKEERLRNYQLDHPGIVRLFFTFQDTFSLYMALESCEGGELFDQITRSQDLRHDSINLRHWIICLGPENLLLTAEGHIKIADFGSVKPMQDSQITILPNASSDDKACTIVGTAAYVPPEVLNSSPATFGLFSFKDASEWLIFQRIIARDIRYPNYFSEEARDLIDQLLDIDPTRRPGAGPDGYDSLKMHPFFRGVDWKNLRVQNPPQLALEQKAHSSDSDDVQDSSWNPSHIGDGSTRQHDGNGGSASSSDAGHVTRIASIDSFDSKWQQFLEPGNIIWSDNSNELNVQVMSPSLFKIFTPKKVLSFEDAKQRAMQWKKAIEALQNR
ncbi:3-phosphoinositide-dependent protein kinase 2 [Camellia lanceoleosa]|uniref:3-phosphoinositide-dependent protein kinase 2 n=1 Tax=Camellia lanceoleosa TaxID=1840588 RepID=A0ACC0H730_9ERIC|nr:3-phosphoinositide-dependent protein kinase 2 [Camellia lanceoleosa]